MATFSPKMLSGLIGSIYDCALDPDHWERTLAAIVEAFECDKAILSLNDLHYDRAVISRSVGWSSHWLDERAKHLPEIHARLTEWFARRTSLDEPFVSSRNLPPENSRTSSYVKHCLKPQRIIDIAHFILIRESAHFAELVLARHERQNVISQREIELGALLLPHLRRAVTISNVLDTRTIESARMTEALDALRCGVILTNEHAAVLHLNRSAEQMLQKDGPIRCIRGVLQVKHQPACKEMRKAIMLAAQGDAMQGETGFAILLTAPGASPFFAHVLPLIGSELRSRLRPDATAAVFIGSPLQAQDGADLLRRAFDLTRGEARVAASLLAGRKLTETAVELGVAPSTVKTHLDNIFSKTGVARQADLIRLAMQLIPPASAV